MWKATPNKCDVRLSISLTYVEYLHSLISRLVNHFEAVRYLAQGFLLCSTLQQLGVRIPEQVSIVSFDNGYLSQVSMPPITSMDINLKLYERKAVEQLMRRMDHPSEPFTELLLPTKILIRQSTGPAPN
jgi:hypothetical protein